VAAESGESPTAVYAGIAGNIVIALAKFVAAFFSGSAAMLAEGIHSLVDTANELLLLFGLRQSKRPPDETHPFGHGQELYFWTLIVAMLLFGLGGGVSIYEGIRHLQHPAPLEDAFWSYVVLAIAFVAESVSLGLALKDFLPTTGGKSIWQALRDSKDPTVVTLIGENGAAMVGVIVAAIGVFLSHRLQQPELDGVASIIIGAVLAVVAIFLTYESKGLLVGETADLAIVHAIRHLAESDPAVQAVGYPYTLHFGPHEILLNLELHFQPALTAVEIATAVDRVEKGIRSHYPQITRIFIEAEAFTAAQGAGTR